MRIVLLLFTIPALAACVSGAISANEHRMSTTDTVVQATDRCFTVADDIGDMEVLEEGCMQL